MTIYKMHKVSEHTYYNVSLNDKQTYTSVHRTKKRKRNYIFKFNSVIHSRLDDVAEKK